jgi:hypothetical protein
MPADRWFTMQKFLDWANEGWGTGERKARNILKDLTARGKVKTTEEPPEGTSALVRYRVNSST